jgi:hypothetical protein
MSSAAVTVEERPSSDVAGQCPRPSRRRREWVVGAVALAVFATGLGYLVGNEVQANTQFDGAHRSLNLARQQMRVVLPVLNSVRRELGGLDGQVSQSTTALANDVAQLLGVQGTLAGEQSVVSRQGSSIGDLHSCLGGVEQALNALSVGDQGSAIDALDAVATSCQSAVASDG